MKRRMSKQQHSLACHHVPPVSHGLSKQTDLSSIRGVRVSLPSLQPDAEMQRPLELPAATQTITIAVKTRNSHPLFGQGMRSLLEKGWTRAFQGVKNGAIQIKEDVVWLLKRARASLATPRVPGCAWGTEQFATPAAQLCFHLVALQSGGLWQDKFNRTLFSPSWLSQQDPAARSRRRKSQAAVSSVALAYKWWDMPICP